MQYSSLPSQRQPATIRRLDSATRKQLERNELDLKYEQEEREQEEKIVQEAIKSINREQELTPTPVSVMQSV